MALVKRSFDVLRNTVGYYAWAPAVELARRTILSTLQRIEGDQLILVNTDGVVTICGSQDALKREGLTTTLRVKKDAFWVRLLLFADMGFAESFMLDEFTCSDFVSFFQIFIRNRTQLSNGTTLASSLASSINSLAKKTNTLANAQLNISAHYDISNAMFAAFLSDDMTYSCPIWAPQTDPLAKGEDLQDAQERKLQYFIDAVKMKPTDHVLEIGTGWGSLAIMAVKKTGCRITSLTLSREQKELAEDRIAAAGLTERIEVLLCDYRKLPMPTEGPYDKIVSIEMIEAVGREFLDTYFECVNKLLKPEGGIACFQAITIPESRYESYSKGDDFIRKYIFPGGHLPSVSQLVGSIERGSKGTLVVDAILNIGGHYAKTLRLWREKFEANFEQQVRPALLREHEGMTASDTALFRRKWMYYFTYCEAAFNTKTLGDVIITVGREGAMEMLEGIPL